MVKIFSIVIITAGVVMLISGLRAALSKLKMKENDVHARLYAGTQGILAGLGAIFLGIILLLFY